MIVTNLSANCINKNDVLAIGRQLENNYRQIVFDCSGFGVEVSSITLIHQRSQDVAPYLVETSNTNSLTWTITDTDTSFSGYGKAELRITFTNGLAKSAAFTTFVIASITADAVIPSSLQSWYDAMIDYIDENTITEDDLDQAIADYIAEHPITAPVTSVNGEIGDVVLTASDVGALPDNTVIPTKTSQLQNDSGFLTSAPVTSVNGQTGDVTLSIPTKTSDLNNDSGFITSAPVTSVNSKTGAVSLSASDVGALPDSTTFVSSFNGNTGAVTYTAPVTSVNGQTGAVTVTDTNTTYTISISGNVITLTPSSGTAQSITVPTEWTVQNMTSGDTTVTLNTNTFYVFPEMSSLTVTVTATGMYAFRFESGATPTTLTVTGATMPDSFTVEANKTYEVNVYQGYAVVQSWS